MIGLQLRRFRLVCARTQVLNFICDELEERTEMLHQLLPRFDTDGNGKITHAEFHKGKRNRTARHGMPH